MLKNLGKLLRYEFKFYFHIMTPLYLALIVVSLVFRVQNAIEKEGGAYYIPSWIAVIGIVVATAIITVNLVLVIQRFRDNMLGDPGYLMFTLPVSMNALVVSKAIAALAISVTSALSFLVSLMLLFLFNKNRHEDLLRTWNEILSFLNEYGAGIAILTIGAYLTLLLAHICLFYSVITASQILPRFRLAAAFGLYIALMLLVEKPVFQFIIGIRNYAGNLDAVRLQIALMGLAGLVFAVLYTWITSLLLKRTLNLE